MRINWCLVVCLVYVRCSHAALSGLYIDNGVDQTIIHHTMTRTEKQMVELEILELLGLGERPRRARAPALDRSAPNFLLDVYRQLAEELEQPHPTRPTRASHDDTIPLTGDDQQHIDESDVIMTFQSKKHNLGALRHGHGQHVWFDVGALPAEQQLVSAALRLHQAAPFRDHAAHGALYTVSVHKVLSVDNFGSLKMLEVTAVNTTAAYEGWLELNVTGVLASWTASPADNKGFFVTVHAHSMPERDLKPEIIGIEDEHAAEGKQPFMVAFFKATGRINSVEVAVTRKKRETRRRRKDYGYSENYIRNPLTDASHWTTRSCEIQTLYVSFKDLEWQDWIIAPDGYGAYYCSGECNFPLNAHKNATNHAIVQTLVHLLNPTQVPKPSCAPTKLSAISVLYYTDDSNVILRKYKNMVVKSCGCH